MRAFRQALKDTGYVEGENAAIVYRWAEGRYDRLPELAAELVRRQVAVIAASDTGSATAAKAATTTIPIVFGVSEDPVRLGLVASLSRPGGNATGVNFFVTELGSKQLGLLHELIPAAARVGLLVNPNYPTTKRAMRDVMAAASAIGLQVDVVQASDSREIESVFGTLVRNRADALLVGPDAFFVSRRLQLAILAARHAIPAVYNVRTSRPDRLEARGVGASPMGASISLMRSRGQWCSAQYDRCWDHLQSRALSRPTDPETLCSTAQSRWETCGSWAPLSSRGWR